MKEQHLHVTLRHTKYHKGDAPTFTQEQRLPTTRVDQHERIGRHLR